ncbi:MAG: hypothetical protein NT051_06735, partial [Candidatus Micrarchaeota archaeon]|nr:hypothetical protein [Candidatus Micrarchaeota archaeon]
MEDKRRGFMRKGFFFTLDVSIALLLLMIVGVLAFSYFGRMHTDSFESALQYTYSQDAAMLLAHKGCLQKIACPKISADPSCAEEILVSSPASSCIEVSGYSVYGIDANGRMVPSEKELLFTLTKQGCAYSGGALQTISLPFSCSPNQSATLHYLSVVRTWQ